MRIPAYPLYLIPVSPIHRFITTKTVICLHSQNISSALDIRYIFCLSNNVYYKLSHNHWLVSKYFRILSYTRDIDYLPLSVNFQIMSLSWTVEQIDKQ